MLYIEILSVLGLSLKYFKPVIKGVDRSFKGSKAPMIYLDKYEFKYLNMGKIKFV